MEYSYGTVNVWLLNCTHSRRLDRSSGFSIELKLRWKERHDAKSPHLW